MATNKHPEDVKALVRKTGVSLAELARRHGLAAVSGRRCLYEPVPSANRAIAEHLGKTVHEIWPEWFDAKGERILRFSRKRITPDAAAQRLKRSAA